MLNKLKKMRKRRENKLLKNYKSASRLCKLNTKKVVKLKLKNSDKTKRRISYT